MYTTFNSESLLKYIIYYVQCIVNCENGWDVFLSAATTVRK